MNLLLTAALIGTGAPLPIQRAKVPIANDLLEQVYKTLPPGRTAPSCTYAPGLSSDQIQVTFSSGFFPLPVLFPSLPSWFFLEALSK